MAPPAGSSRSAARSPAGSGGGGGDIALDPVERLLTSLSIRHGESVKTVQARLGHASASETLDTNAYLWPDSEDRTRVAVDSVLGLAAAWGEIVGVKVLVRGLVTVSRPVGGELARTKS
jgi:hypothetical protein